MKKNQSSRPVMFALIMFILGIFILLDGMIFQKMDFIYFCIGLTCMTIGITLMEHTRRRNGRKQSYLSLLKQAHYFLGSLALVMTMSDSMAFVPRNVEATIESEEHPTAEFTPLKVRDEKAIEVQKEEERQKQQDESQTHPADTSDVIYDSV